MLSSVTVLQDQEAQVDPETRENTNGVTTKNNINIGRYCQIKNTEIFHLTFIM